MTLRAWLAISLALVVSALWPMRSIARQSAPIAEVTQIDWGWGGVLVASRWCPVWITVQAGPEPVQGELTIEYDQDLSQRAAIRSPLALAPSQRATIMIPICPPRFIREATVTLRAVSPSDSISSVINCTPFNEGLAALPIAISTSITVIGVLGSVTGVDSTMAAQVSRDLWPSAKASVLEAFEPQVLRIKIASLPLLSAAWQSLDVLVVHAEQASTIEPRALAVIRQWVLGGGRLIVIADQPGPGWARWLPAMMSAPDWIAMPEPQSIAAWPEALQKSLNAVGIDPKTAARPFTLGPRAKAEGWATHWTTESGAALGATGPVGFGLVTLLGVEPSRLPKVVGDAGAASAVRALWGDLIRGIMPTERQREPASTDFGEDRRNGLITMALDQIVSVPPVGGDIAWAAFITVGVLALLLGPIDYFVLGWLRARQRSWMSACLWIALASGVAIILPSALRSGGSSASSLTVTDHLMPIDRASLPLVWSGRVCTLFADGPMRAEWDPRPAGTAVQGVSIDSIRVQSSSLPTLPLQVRSAALDAQTDQWGGYAPDAAAGDGVVIPDPRPTFPTFVRRWSLRCVAEDGRAASPLKAWTQVGDRGVGVVHLTGLSPDAQVLAFRLRDRDGYAPCQIARSAEGWQFMVTSAGEDQSANAQWRLPETRSATPGTPASPAQLAEAADRLPIVECRQDSSNQRVRHGEWITLSVLVLEPPGTSPGVGPAQNQTAYTLHRMQVPAPAWSTVKPQEMSR